MPVAQVLAEIESFESRMLFDNKSNLLRGNRRQGWEPKTLGRLSNPTLRIVDGGFETPNVDFGDQGAN
jgi:hypothetical protein